MSEDSKPADATPTPRKRSWRTPALIAGVIAVGISGAVATTALGDNMRFGDHMRFGDGERSGWMGERHGPHGWHGRQLDPAQLDAAIERGVRHMAIEIDATPDQQAKLITIAQAAARELQPLRAKVEAARKQGHALLVSPDLDAAKIEAFRAEQMALADQASRRVAKAVTDVTEVLTPEQRAKLGDRLGRIADFRGRGHRG